MKYLLFFLLININIFATEYTGSSNINKKIIKSVINDITIEQQKKDSNREQIRKFPPIILDKFDFRLPIIWYFERF